VRPSPRGKFDPRRVFETLARHKVDFVVIGGLAGRAWGSAFVTEDTDVAYARDDDNLERLAAALREMNAHLRGAPPDVPFLLDAKSLRNGLNFTFDTDYGSFDILGEPAGAPAYVVLRESASQIEIAGADVLVASLDHLIAMKEAAGRTRDKVHASEYRVISDLLRAPSDET
jgi:hypothetical protein